MKTLSYLALILLSFTFFSCEKLDELTEHDFTTTLVVELPVSWHADDTQFSESSFVSLDNNDTHDYLDLLEDVDIQQITYHVKNYDCSDCTSTCDAYLKVHGNTVEEVQDFDVKEAYQNQTVFEASNTNGFNDIAHHLLENYIVYVEYGATDAHTTADVNFTVEVKIKLKVTADAL